MNIDSYEIVEFIDLLNHTFSEKFVEKWRYKYSTSFIKKFQYKILKSITDKKPIKKRSLKQYLSNKCKYNNKQIDNFFDDIEIEIYYPLVM
jgi:hypothetical protein